MLAASVSVPIKHQNEGKKDDLCDSDHGMIVGARWVGFRISETDDLLGFCRQTLNKCLHRTKKKKSCYTQKCLVDEDGQKAMAGLGMW